jgi:WD40 repeat protein
MDAHRGSINSVVFSQDGSRIVSGSDDNMLKVWDANSFEMIGKFYTAGPVKGVAVSWPRIAAGALSGELYHVGVIEGAPLAA